MLYLCSYPSSGVPIVPAGVLVSLPQEHLRCARAGLTSGGEGIRLYRTTEGEQVLHAQRIRHHGSLMLACRAMRVFHVKLKPSSCVTAGYMI